MQLPPTPTTTPTGQPPAIQVGQAEVAAPPTPKGGVALPKKQADPTALIGPAAWLAFGLLVTALVLVVVDRWRKRQSRGGSSFGSLSEYRQMYEDGELTEAEYNKLRAKLAPKIKAELKVKPPSPAPQPPLPPLPPGDPPTDPPVSS